jgi:hypothetical protein
LEQVRADINGCAAVFASTQGGSVRQVALPVDAGSYLPDLHADGFLSADALAEIRQFLAPAEQANFFSNARIESGPPGSNGAQRLACLLHGKALTEDRDTNGITHRDRALAEVASAITEIERQWWRVW